MSTVSIDELATNLYAALNRGDEEQTRKIGVDIARQAEDDFPVFHDVLNALGFHNRLDLINQMMLTAWPQVQAARSYSRPAVEIYAARATDHLIYAFIEDSSTSATHSERLVERLEAYFAVESDRLQSYLGLLSGAVGRAWSAADLEPLRMPTLSGLMVEFLGFTHRLNIPFARAHLFREMMPGYFLDRHAGNLQPKADMAAVLRQGGMPPAATARAELHPLVPDRASLTLYLQRALQTIQPQPYGAAIIVILLPYWCDFLTYRNLTSESVTGQVSAFLPALRQELAPFWAGHPDRQLAAAV